MADGHLNKCKECTRKDVAAHYNAHHDKVAEYDRKRQQTPERRAKKRVYAVHYRHRNPEKTRARRAVIEAIRAGLLRRLPCEVCGTTEAVQAHHHDYSKPLDVRWLCFRHHREVGHGQRVAG